MKKKIEAGESAAACLTEGEDCSTWWSQYDQKEQLIDEERMADERRRIWGRGQGRGMQRRNKGGGRDS
jgi:hypothetical protein